MPVHCTSLSNSFQCLYPKSGSQSSRQHGRQNFAVDVGETAFGAVVVEGELLVVEAEEAKYGGVEVIDGADILLRLVAELVGGAVADSAFHACAGHPGGEAVGVMVAALGAGLVGGHAAELGGPEEERV